MKRNEKTPVQSGDKMTTERFIREVDTIYRTIGGEVFTADSPESVVAYLRGKGVQHRDYECFGILITDVKNRVVVSCEFGRGDVSGASVSVREVLRMALLANASGLILYHNHPSGMTDPSAQDIRLTLEIRDASKIFNITLLDHVIIGDGYHSMKDSGHLRQELTFQ